MSDQKFPKRTTMYQRSDENGGRQRCMSVDRPLLICMLSICESTSAYVATYDNGAYSECDWKKSALFHFILVRIS